MKTYLVTGGAGFIGSNFIIHLLRRHDDIRVINLDKLTYAANPRYLKPIEHDARYRFVQADICDHMAVREVLQSERIDYLVNFAAESHVDRSIVQPDVFIQTNIEGVNVLLEEAKRAWQIDEDTYQKGCRFLQVSTDEVYGTLGPTGRFTEHSPLNPRSPYSASKASADLLARAYFETYRLPVNITRCSNNFGPGQYPEKLIPLMICKALTHQGLPVYGDGLQVRDWIYVEDHCRAVDHVLRMGKPGEIYNIGARSECANLQLVQWIVDYLHEQVDDAISRNLIAHVPDRKGHDRRYAVDPQKIERELGWSATTNFTEAMEKTIAWYVSHPEHCLKRYLDAKEAGKECRTDGSAPSDLQ